MPKSTAQANKDSAETDELPTLDESQTIRRGRAMTSNVLNADSIEDRLQELIQMVNEMSVRLDQIFDTVSTLHADNEHRSKKSSSCRKKNKRAARDQAAS
jgi:hypothetical protein